MTFLIEIALTLVARFGLYGLSSKGKKRKRKKGGSERREEKIESACEINFKGLLYRSVDSTFQYRK